MDTMYNQLQGKQINDTYCFILSGVLYVNSYQRFCLILFQLFGLDRPRSLISIDLIKDTKFLFTKQAKERVSCQQLVTPQTLY